MRIAVATMPSAELVPGCPKTSSQLERGRALDHDAVGAVASAVGHSGARSAAIRLTCSITMASSPSTTPMVSKRTAPTVPASITPLATSRRGAWGATS